MITTFARFVGGVVLLTGRDQRLCFQNAGAWRLFAGMLLWWLDAEANATWYIALC